MPLSEPSTAARIEQAISAVNDDLYELAMLRDGLCVSDLLPARRVIDDRYSSPGQDLRAQFHRLVMYRAGLSQAQRLLEARGHSL